jgi:hypothetical protein
VLVEMIKEHLPAFRDRVWKAGAWPVSAETPEHAPA